MIQPYAGWAFRWAIGDMRARGMSWTTIAGIVGRPHPTLLRQFIQRPPQTPSYPPAMRRRQLGPGGARVSPTNQALISLAVRPVTGAVPP